MVCLKAKSYSILLQADSDQFFEEMLQKVKGKHPNYRIRPDELLEYLKSKGVPGVALKNITHDMFVTVLLKDRQVLCSYNKLSTHNHQVIETSHQRIALTSFDDKRFLLDCSIHSLPYGSVHIPENGICDCDRLG